MIIYDDIVEVLGTEVSEAEFNKVLVRVKGVVEDYTNNSELFIVDVLGKVTNPPAIDDVLLYLCVERLNPDTKLRAGKASESVGGINISFLNDLPSEVKLVLNKYRRARTI